MLSSFNLIRAPQGLTNDKFTSLMNLSQKLDPIQRFVSVIIDETPLTPKLNFDSNGMIIGHAVNDTINEENENSLQNTPNEALANRMLCYLVQGNLLGKLGMY